MQSCCRPDSNWWELVNGAGVYTLEWPYLNAKRIQTYVSMDRGWLVEEVGS